MLRQYREKQQMTSIKFVEDEPKKPYVPCMADIMVGDIFKFIGESTYFMKVEVYLARLEQRPEIQYGILNLQNAKVFQPSHEEIERKVIVFNATMNLEKR